MCNSQWYNFLSYGSRPSSLWLDLLRRRCDWISPITVVIGSPLLSMWLDLLHSCRDSISSIVIVIGSHPSSSWVDLLCRRCDWISSILVVIGYHALTWQNLLHCLCDLISSIVVVIGSHSSSLRLDLTCCRRDWISSIGLPLLKLKYKANKVIKKDLIEPYSGCQSVLENVSLQWRRPNP